MIAAFSRAAYVGLDCPAGTDVDVVALVTSAAASGPLHLRGRLPIIPAVGDPVAVGDAELRVAGRAIAIPAQRWSPPDIPGLASRRGMASETIATVLDHVPDLALGSAAPDPAAIPSLICESGLTAAVARLAGRGSGLTPAGDDVAAGILLVARILGLWPTSRLAQVARAHETHVIAAAFVRAAAAGQTIAPVHDLVAAAALGDVDAARTARERLARIGHTSGLDLAYGVMVALDSAAAIAAECPAPGARARGL